MASTTEQPAADVLAAYLKQHGAGLSAGQLRTIGIARRAAQYRNWTVTDLRAALHDTLPLGPTDAKPIYMIGPDGAAYLLSIIESS